MLIRTFAIPGLAVNSFLIYDEETKHGVLIDPTRQIEPYLEFASKHKVEIAHILETHVHADFCSGAPELKSALGGRPLIHCSAMGGPQWIPAYADRLIYDRDQLEVGGFHLAAWHTPGHTEEHLIWLLYDEKRLPQIPECAFTGDLLFVGSVGRPDLLGLASEEKLVRELYHTLFFRLQSLPEFVEIFPSHGAGSLCGKDIGARDRSTWGYEKRSNPYLRPAEFEQWRAHLLHDLPAVPDYFRRMKQLNLQGQLGQAERWPLMLPMDEIECSEQVIVIDIRAAEAFALSHLKGSINIPFTPQFIVWAGVFIRPAQKIFLIVQRVSEVVAVMQALRLLGFDQIEGYALFDGAVRGKVDSIPLITPFALQKQKEELFLLDVRTPAEWSAGHIVGAHHLELTLLPHALAQLPKEKQIATICRSGRRASTAASYLKRHGFEHVAFVGS